MVLENHASRAHADTRPFVATRQERIACEEGSRRAPARTRTHRVGCASRRVCVWYASRVRAPPAMRSTVVALTFSVVSAKAHAQSVAGDPPRRTTAIPLVSLRMASGGGLVLAPQLGGAFVLRGTVGVRVFLSTQRNHSRGWMLGADVGVDGAWALGARDATLLSFGLSAGRLWELVGLAWAPRLLYGWREGEDAQWGVRNGVRVLFGGGVFDVELAHQYVAGARSDEHELQLVVGVDFGLVAHAVAQIGAPEQR